MYDSDGTSRWANGHLLRRTPGVAPDRFQVSTWKPIGERLLDTGLITEEQLHRALQAHQQTGLRIGQALVSLGYITEEKFAAALADQNGLRFVDLRALEPHDEASRLVPEELQSRHGVMPLYDDGKTVVVGFRDAPQACQIEELERVLGRTIDPVIVSESALEDSLHRVFRDEYLERSTSDLASRFPEDSAKWVLSHRQKQFLWGILMLLGLAIVIAPIETATLLMALCTGLYVGTFIYKGYLAYRATTHKLDVEITPADIAALNDMNLPVYTILVPVYREAEVLPVLVQAIEHLDYPKAKLDVKILLEEDDHETLEVARKSNLPSHFKLVVVPNGQPKGKPKACNYGLINARGEYVVIYDAEDIPEPDQLKMALVAFQKGGTKLACVQAKLNFFNRDQNLLTRFFTTEYSMWFDLFLPGLYASGAPIPLGGTSNHFQTARLHALGAWDPYNVTEDADLGIRLYKRGWRTAVIDSTTHEEANSNVYNWIRQRSRWIKGYIQTYLVHMRHPMKLWQTLGPKAFLSFQFVLCGTFLCVLMNPVLWILTVLWFITHSVLIKDVLPAPGFYAAMFALYIGNFSFSYLNAAGSLKRGYYHLVKYALMSPIYWVLMSVAAWKGLFQLFYNASYWEKTRHGLYKGEIKVLGIVY
jgi:cellulose synthase/poly-beta-1,6-N-acetylglucosamine synthase-like glycosyltransferase